MTTKKVRTKSTSIQKILEFATGLTKLPQSLGLDLPDPLPGHVELAPDLLQGVGMSVLQAKTIMKHLPLPAGQRSQHLLDLFVKQMARRSLVRTRQVPVLDKVTQLTVLLLPYRDLQKIGRAHV